MLRAPVAITVGLAIGVLGAVITMISNLGEPAFESIARAQLARMAAAVTEYALVAIGVFELARRTSGNARQLLRWAAVLFLAVCAWYALRPVIDVLVDERRMWVIDVSRWGFFGSGLCSLIAVILLGVVARAPIVLCAAIAVLARGWIPYVTDDLHLWLFEHHEVAAVYWLVQGMLFAIGVLGACARVTATPATSDPEAATAGFHNVANALRLRVVGAIVFAFLATGMVRSNELRWFIVLGAPLVVIATLVIVALGCLRVARAQVDHMPRWRFAIGGGLSLWWAVVQYEQVFHLFRDHDVITGAGQSFASAWSIAGPLIATAALGLVGSAISAFAHARSNDELRESAAVRTLLFIVLSASSVGIQSQVWKAETRDGFLMLMFVAAAAGIAALVAFAGLARQAADAIDTGPTLPKARVTSTKA